MSKPAKPYLRSATTEDFWRFYGRAAPEGFAGMVLDAGDMLLGIGGSYWSDGRVWCSFAMAPGVRTHKIAMHRAGVVLMGSLAQAGIEAVYALCHPTRPGAAAWIARLGFAPTGEMKNGIEVWRWTSAQ